MKVLWLFFPCSWITPLFNALSAFPQLQLAVVSPTAKGNVRKEIREGTLHYFIPTKKQETTQYITKSLLDSYRSIIDDFQPDIIHVHGTETNFGQIRKIAQHIPVVISIQGILDASKVYSLGYLEPSALYPFKSLKNLLGFGGARSMERRIRASKKFETDVFTSNSYFIGRTEWDRAQVMYRSPNSSYFHGEELLREPFYTHAGKWDINTCERHSLFMLSGFNPIKGLHIAIQAIRLLKDKYPHIKLYVPGIGQDFLNRSTGWNFLFGEEQLRYVFHLIKKSSLEPNIIFLPYLNAEEMCLQMKTKQAFLSPSSIDNSPNSIGEAMSIGIPVIATMVGGIPSFLTNNTNALLTPAGDPYLMAYQIDKLFNDDSLAQSISEAGQKTAQNRHNKEKTALQYFTIYETILKRKNEK